MKGYTIGCGGKRCGCKVTPIGLIQKLSTLLRGPEMKTSAEGAVEPVVAAPQPAAGPTGNFLYMLFTEIQSSSVTK